LKREEREGRNESRLRCGQCGEELGWGARSSMMLKLMQINPPFDEAKDHY